MNRRYSIWLVWWACMGMCTAAQAVGKDQEVPKVINYTSQHYKAQHQNWMIAHSADGYLYFANTEGLLEFDGASWQIYKLPERQTIRSVAVDSLNRIYTGAYGEFGYWWRNEKGLLSYFSLCDPSLDQKMAEEEFWNIQVSGQGVYFQSFSVIYFYNYREVIPLHPPSNIMYLEKIGDNIFLPVIDKGLFEMQKNQEFKMVDGGNFFQDKRIKAIMPHPGGILIGAEPSGCFLYADNWIHEWNPSFNKILNEFQLNKAVALPNGYFAFGTILNGVYITDSTGNILFHLNKENGLQNNTILAMHPDGLGNLWLGLDKGIDLIDLNNPLLFNIDKAGKIGTVFTAALFQNLLYAGTNQGLYVKPFTGAIGQEFQLVKGTQGQVWDLKIFDEQLLCGHNEGTFLINGYHSVKISDVTGGWDLQSFPGLKDTLLQATYTGLVVLHKNEAGKWTFGHRIEGFPKPVKQLAFDVFGNLWVSSPHRGIFRIDFSSDLKRVSLAEKIDGSKGLPPIFDATFSEDRNQLIISSNGANYYWDQGAQQFRLIEQFRNTTLPEANNLVLPLNEKDWCLIADDRIHWKRKDWPEVLLFLNLNKDNGKIIQLKQDLFLFCLDNGYALFPFPTTPLKPLQQIPLRIRKITYQNSGPLTHTLAQNAAELNHLPFYKGTLSIHFAKPVYYQPILFRHRLSGFQEHWSAWSAQTYSEYTNLPPGTYQFQVQNNLDNDMAEVSLRIMPKWHQTMLARALFLMVFSGVVLWGLALNNKRMNHLRIKKEKERIRQLEENFIKSQNQKLEADLMDKSRQLTTSTFDLIRKNEILDHLKTELLSIKEDLGNRFPDKYFNRLAHQIEIHLSADHDWEIFQTNFNRVHGDFFKKLSAEFPELTPGDLKVASLLKMNLSSKEIAQLLNISVRGVENKRYRLRKKMNLPEEANLTEFMILY